MTLYFRSPKSKPITHGCQVLINETKGCSPCAEISCFKIHIVKTGYFTINFNAAVKSKCPVDLPFLKLVNLTTKETVASILLSDPCENIGNVSLVLDACTDLAFKLKARGYYNFKLSGDVSCNEEVALDQLAGDIAYDRSIKVQYVTSKPGDLPCPAAPFEPQTITDDDTPLPSPPFPPETLPWTSNIIPWYTGQSSPNGGVFANGTTTSGNYYRKFQSIPYILAYYAGLDFETIPPDSPVLTVFLKDFQERGPSNLAKTDYIYALTTDKMPFYVDKMRNLINTVYTAVVSNGAPIVSTFREALVEFFVAIHTGVDDYPDFVIRYFSLFIDVIGFISNPNIDIVPWLLEGRSLEPKIREYYAERTNIVLTTEDKTTFVFWWNQAGLAIPSLVTESLHNIIAFAQFVNTFYKTVVDKVWAASPPPYDPSDPDNIPCWFPKTIIPFIPLPGPAAPYSIGPVDFFAKYGAETDPAQRLNIIRELYRLLLPNSNAFSKMNDSASPDNIQVRNIWAQMMIAQQPVYNPYGTIPLPPPLTPQILSYYAYRLNPALPALNPGFAPYPGFDTVPYPDVVYHPDPPPISVSDNINSIDFVEFSPADNDATFNDGTVLDRYNEKSAPVTGSGGSDLPFPYYPFGTSYRRCPGEIFNYFLTELLVDKFSDIEFEFREVEPCCNPENPDTSRYVAIAPRTAVFDNLFVKGPVFPV